MITIHAPSGHWKAIAMAYLYLLMLFLSIVIMWAVVLIGGNPLTVMDLQLYNQNGVVQQVVNTGQNVAVKGKFCSTKSMGVEIYPFIEASDGNRHPLPNSMVLVQAGCFSSSYGFTVPDVPEGNYSLRAVIKFQNNLVGRDESALTPNMMVRILK